MNLLELFATISMDPSGFLTGAYMVMDVVGKVTKAFVDFAADSVKTGMEFDSSMSQVAATMGMSMQDIKGNVDGAGDTFQLLRDKALEMGSATNFTATQAAEGLNILAMAGYDAQDSVGMIEDVLHLAAAGGMDLADSASYISGAVKGFADDTKDATYYADLMAKGATMANTSVSQLGEAFQVGAATAASYNQSAEGMTVSLLRLAEQGSVGSEAATSLNRAMADLYTPTDAAAQAMAQLGISAYDSNGEARDFNEVIDELNGALSGMTQEEKNAYASTIFTTKGLQAFNKMTVTSTDKVADWADSLADATGSAALQYETMTDNLQGDIDIMNSAMDGLKIALSDKLTPTIRDIVQFGSSAVSELTAAFQNEGIAGAMQVFADIVGNGLVAVAGKLPEFIATGTEMVISLVQGIMDGMPGFIDTIFEMIKTFLVSVVNNLPKILTSGMQLLFTFINGIESTFPSLVSGILDLIITIVTTLFKHDWLADGVQLIQFLIEGIISMILNIGKAAQEAADKIIDTIKGVDLFEIGKNIILGLIDGIKSMVGAAVKAVTDTLGNIVNGAKKFLGIHSPSRVFAEMGEYSVMGFGKGWEDEYPAVKDMIQSDLDFASNLSVNGADGFETGSSVRESDSGEASLVDAIIDAISGLTIELDNREVGRVVRAYV